MGDMGEFKCLRSNISIDGERGKELQVESVDKNDDGRLEGDGVAFC